MDGKAIVEAWYKADAYPLASDGLRRLAHAIDAELAALRAQVEAMKNPRFWDPPAIDALIRERDALREALRGLVTINERANPRFEGLELCHEWKTGNELLVSAANRPPLHCEGCTGSVVDHAWGTAKPCSGIR